MVAFVIIHIKDNISYAKNTSRYCGETQLSLKNHKKFNTRKWAVKNTGYLRSTKILNALLKKASLKRGDKWTRDIVPKINRPNAMYKYEKDRKALEPERKKLIKFLIK